MGSYKIDFDLADYEDILPDINEYLKHDEILNIRDFEKGNIEECYWKPYIPSSEEVKSESFREREARRVLKTGVWMANKTEIIWLPPAYYDALQYAKPGGDPLEFRLKTLKKNYIKTRARNNPYCIGTMEIKNRQDGATTDTMTNVMWQVKYGNLNVGGVGMQSMTKDKAEETCWRYILTMWQFYEKWYKKLFFPDYKASGKDTQKMVFKGGDGSDARNIVLKYFASKHNAMDGMSKLVMCVLDEYCKWTECEFSKTVTNYKKFILPGKLRNGLFEMISTPADFECKSNNDAYALWKKSDPKNIYKYGLPISRILRIFSNPLDGITGFYDKYGDADPNELYDHVMELRKVAGKAEKMGEVRAYPLDEQEAFESYDTGTIWSNTEGINKRKIYLINRMYKDEAKTERMVYYGNLEYIDGIKDNDVRFVASDKMEFDEIEARFCFSYFLKNKLELKRGSVYSPFDGSPMGRRFLAPQKGLIETVLGIDGYAKRYKTGNRNSNGAMVAYKFRDFYGTGINKVPIMTYRARPQHNAIFHEDAIKAAIFLRALVQPEDTADKVTDYFDDRGYFDWLLDKKGGKNGLRKGDAPSSKGAYLDEMIGMIDALTNTPYEDEEYRIKMIWFRELLEDILAFDRKNTTKSDLTMALGASLIGAAKVVFGEQSQKPQDDLLFTVADLLQINI